MPKVSIYLSDELYDRARARGLSLSTLTQAAVEQALLETDRRAWVLSARGRPALVPPDLDTGELLAAVREEVGR